MVDQIVNTGTNRFRRAVPKLQNLNHEDLRHSVNDNFVQQELCAIVLVRIRERAVERSLQHERLEHAPPNF